MKHSLFKRLIQLLLSLLLLGQIQLIYLSLKHEGIPISKSLYNNYLPENLRLQSEQALFFFPYHFRIIDASLTQKTSHQIRINMPYINLSWSPHFQEQNFNRWSVESSSGTILSNYYPSELKLSQLKLKFVHGGIERGFIQLQDKDKVFEISYHDRQALPIESIHSAAYTAKWDTLDIDTNPSILQLIQSIHASKNTALHWSLERTPHSHLSLKASLSSESISYTDQALKALQVNAHFEAPELNVHFRTQEFTNSKLGLQLNSIYGHYEQYQKDLNPTLVLSANGLQYKNYSLESATAHIEARDDSTHGIEVSLFHKLNCLQIKTLYNNFGDKEPFPIQDLTFKGHIDPKSLHTFIPELKAVPLLKLPSATLYTTGYLKLNSTLEPLRAEGTLQGINFRLGDDAIDYLNSQYQCNESQVEMQTQLRVAERSLTIDSKIDLKDQDYHFLLKGTLYPTDFKTLLPNWWQSIFKKFSFTSQSQVQADFSLHGNFKKAIPDQFLGSVLAKELHYRSVYFPYGRLRIQGANYCTAITLDEIQMDQGQASGQLMTTVKPDGFQEIESLRIDLTGSLSTQNAARLFGGKTAQVLDRFESKESHPFVFKSAFFNPHYQKHIGKSYYNLIINTEKSFRFFQRPFDSLYAKLYGRDSNHFIRSASAGFAQGKAHLQADITQTQTPDPQIELILKLSECNYDLSSQYLFRQIQSNTASAPNRAIKLDLELESKGALFDLTRHQGFGSLNIQGKQLSQIYLLGPFSKALDEIRIPIGTFKLDHLESHFKIQGPSIYVPKLEINGKQSHIYGSGHIQIPNQTIDFDIKVDPLKNAKLSFTLLGELGSRFNPLTHILDFKVSGTAQEQKWRSRFDPRNLFGL